MYQAILFDLDGTLIDSADDLGAALNHVLHLHKRPLVCESLYRTQASNGTLALLKLGFGEAWHTFEQDKTTLLREQFLAFYRKNLWVKSALYPDVVKLISLLEREHIPWSIVTNKPTYLTEPLIEKIRIFNACENIVCGDTLTKSKPHPDPLLHSCTAMSVNPKQCLYIGDDERDIVAGKRAHMYTAVAKWGYLNGSAIENWQADYIFDSCRSLIDHISSD